MSWAAAPTSPLVGTRTGRENAEEQTGGRGGHEGEGQNAQVDLYLSGSNREASHESSEQSESRGGEGEAYHSTGKRHQRAFGQQLTHEPASIGPQSTSERQLLVAPQDPGQSEIRDVGAGDQQDQTGSPEQDQEHGPHVLGELLPDILHRGHEARVRSIDAGIPFGEAVADMGDRGGGDLARDPWLQAAEDVEHTGPGWA